MKKLILFILLIIITRNLLSVDYTTVGQTKLEQNSSNPDLLKYNNFFRLTKNGKNEKGALWITNPVNLNNPFIIEFDANFGQYVIGADGIAFVFHKDERGFTNQGVPDPTGLGTVIGLGGGRMGYGGFGGYTSGVKTTLQIKNSVALEFDTYFNPHPVSIPPFDDYDDLVSNHFDIIRNGDMSVSTIDKVDLIDIEDDKIHQIQIVWVPGQQQANIGTLTVLDQCVIKYTNSNFEIDDDMIWDTWGNSLENVYVGLTSATGNSVNYHRVKLLLPELELTQKQLCGNIQLEANFPNLCGTFKYQWTAEDGSTDGLMNPNSKNPIAYKTGTYKCTVTEINSSYVWSAHIDAEYTDDIYANPVLPDFSFSKLYNNRYKFDNTYVDLDDGICGTQLSLDCGFLVSGWSEFKLTPSGENGYGIWFFKTDYFGNMEFSKNYVASHGVDFSNMNNSQIDAFRCTLISHSLINDFKIRDKPNNCSFPIDNKITPIKEKTGFYITGSTQEVTINGIAFTKIIHLKLDNQGHYVNSVAFELTPYYSIALKTIQTEDDRYITLNRHLNGANGLRGSLTAVCYEPGNDYTSFNLNKQYGFNILGNDFFDFTYSDFELVVNNNSKSISDNYNAIIAVPYDNAVGVFVLDDILNNNWNTILASQSTVQDLNSTDDKSLKVIFNEKEPNNFYVLTYNKIYKFNMNCTLVDTYLFNYPLDFQSYRVVEAFVSNSFNSDNIEFIVSEKGDGQGLLYIRYNLNTHLVTSSLKYNYDINNSFDNLVEIQNGIAFTGNTNNPITKSDVLLTLQNENHLGCAIQAEVGTTQLYLSENSTPFIEIVDISMASSDPGIVEVEHFPEEMGFDCIDAEYCDCSSLDENSLEIYSVAKPKQFDNSDCCFDIYVKNNTNCKLLGYDFSITQSEYGQNQDLPALKYIFSLNPSSSKLLGEICLADGIDDVEISVNIKKNGESEFCLDENLNPLTFKTSVTCFEGCCDYIKVNFIPTDPNGSSCCWIPNITSTNPLCSVSDVDIKYYDNNDVEIPLGSNGELCLESNGNHTITIKIVANGQVCEFRSRTLDCDRCDCPDDFIKSSWLKVDVDKDSPLCPASQCAATVSLDIAPEYQSCYPYFNMIFIKKDKSGNIIENTNYMPNQMLIPPNGILPGFPPCINEGERLLVRVRLYANNTSSDYCELNSPEVMCDRIDNILRPEPCDVNNPTDAWSGEFSKSVILNGCEYIISYVYRKTSDGFQDVQMTSQTKVDKNCITTDTKEDVFRFALPIVIAEILSKQPDWKPKNESLIKCTNIWRVIQHSCWVTFFGMDMEGEFSITEPCISDCCGRQLRVCIDENKKITVEDIGFASGSSTFNCSAQPTPSLEEPNEYTSNTGCLDLNCDIFRDFNGIADQPYDIRKDNIDIISPYKRVYEDRIIKNNYLFLYQVYNDNDIFRLIVKETKFESIKIEVFDINGKLVLSNNFNKVKNGSILDLKISEFSSGSYFINIVCGNGIIGTQKIQLIK